MDTKSKVTQKDHAESLSLMRIRFNWDDSSAKSYQDMTPDSVCLKLGEKDPKRPFIVFVTPQLPRGKMDLKDKKFTKLEKEAYKLSRIAFWSKSYEFELLAYKFSTYVFYVPTTADELAPAIYVCSPEAKVIKKLMGNINNKMLINAMYEVVLPLNKNMKKKISLEQAQLKKIIKNDEALIKLFETKNEMMVKKVSEIQIKRIDEKILKNDNEKVELLSKISRSCEDKSIKKDEN